MEYTYVSLSELVVGTYEPAISGTVLIGRTAQVSNRLLHQVIKYSKFAIHNAIEESEDLDVFDLVEVIETVINEHAKGYEQWFTVSAPYEYTW